jgi:hypothetical protein
MHEILVMNEKLESERVSFVKTIEVLKEELEI